MSFLNPRTALTILLLLAVAGLAGQSFRAQRRLHASRVLKAVELMTPRAARQGDAGRPILASHLRLLSGAIREDPTNVGLLVAESGQLLLLGRHAEAVSVLERAEALEPRAEVFVQLGRARWLGGQHERARDDFRRGLALSPRLRDVLPKEIVDGLEKTPGA